jgi:hypothetical protein
LNSASVSRVRSFTRLKVILTVVATEDVAIIEGRGAIRQALGQDIVKKELAGLLVVDTPWGLMKT